MWNHDRKYEYAWPSRTARGRETDLHARMIIRLIADKSRVRVDLGIGVGKNYLAFISCLYFRCELISPLISSIYVWFTDSLVLVAKTRLTLGAIRICILAIWPTEFLILHLVLTFIVDRTSSQDKPIGTGSCMDCHTPETIGAQVGDEASTIHGFSRFIQAVGVVLGVAVVAVQRLSWKN